MSLFSALLQRSSRRRTYADLMELDDHLLRDIGLSRGDIRQMLRGNTTTSRALAHE